MDTVASLPLLIKVMVMENNYAEWESKIKIKDTINSIYGTHACMNNDISQNILAANIIKLFLNILWTTLLLFMGKKYIFFSIKCAWEMVILHNHGFSLQFSLLYSTNTENLFWVWNTEEKIIYTFLLTAYFPVVGLG